MGSSHFGLTPRNRINILGSRFLGSFDRGERGKPRLDEIMPDPSGLDLGLRAEHVQEIYDAHDKNRVLVIVAPTGAGKSTVIPFRLISPLETSGLRHDHFTSNGRPIVVTQPRRVATSDIPGVIARKLYGTGVGPGSEIGYRHGQDREQTDPWNRLIFVTDGTLLNWLTDHRAGEFSIVIIDEAHERSTTIDLILALMRAELIKHPHLRLVILSATIHAEKFVQYFESVLPGEVWHRDFQECEKSFGYECRWGTGSALEPSTAAEAMASKVVELIRSTNEGGILGFMPGEEEIKETLDLVAQRLDQATLERTMLRPLYAALESAEIARATGPIEPIEKRGKSFVPRRVVIATNIAETSLTIPDVVHVIDSGLIKESSWNPITQTEGLQTRWHSQAGCRQRWGRAGRNRPGIVYPLYTKGQFDSFDPYTRPAIVREALDDALIKATRAGVTDFTSFEWLDPPDTAEISRVKNAISTRRLTDTDGDPTNLGSEVFEVYQRIGRFIDESAGSASRALDMASLLLLSDRYACLIEAVTFLVLLPHIGANLYNRQNGLFRFEASWPVEKRDRVGRMQESLRAGCIDDLDFAIKVAALFEGLTVGDRMFGGKEWAANAAVNVDILGQAIASRDDVLGVFVREVRDRGIRRLDLSLIDRLRLLVAIAWPDKRVRMEKDGWWSALDKARGKLSLHSLANTRALDSSAFIASFGRPIQDATSTQLVPVASVLVCSPDEDSNRISDMPLAKRIHRQRLDRDFARLHHRLLADQLFPVGTPFQPGGRPTEILNPASSLSYNVKPNNELAQSIPTAISAWQDIGETGPVAVLDPQPITTQEIAARPGERITVRFLRRVTFPPNGGASEFVCLTERHETFYVDVGDLNLSPWNPVLDRYVGTRKSLVYVGKKPNGQLIASLLFDLEKGWEQIRERSRLWGTVTSVIPGESTEARVGVQIQDLTDPNTFHFSTVLVQGGRKHLAAIKVGDVIYFSLRPARSEPWIVKVEESSEFSASVIAALKSVGITWEVNQAKTDKRLSIRDMYQLILSADGTEAVARQVFRVTHAFNIDADSIDTDASFQRASELLNLAANIWADAWSGDRTSVRERIKEMQAILKNAEVSAFSAMRVRERLDLAWTIQDLRYQTEEKAARAIQQSAYVAGDRQKYFDWMTRLEAEVAKLADWVANSRTEEKRLRYTQFLMENRQKLTSGRAELRGREAKWAQIAAEVRLIEQEVSAAKARLAEMRSAGMPHVDLSGGRSAPVDPETVHKKRGRPAKTETVAARKPPKLEEKRLKGGEAQGHSTPFDTAAVRSPPAAPMIEETRLDLREDQVSRLSTSSVGFLGALFGSKPKKSILQTVTEQLSVTIEVINPRTILIRGKSRTAILAAEKAIRERLT
jgi:hypothetical protein